ISKKKCHYYGRQSNGTLLGVEILHLFAQHFKNFAEPLIARKCEGEPRQQHQWMIDFFVSNPLLIDFFKENGCLLLEKEWQDIQNLRNYAVQLQDLMIKGEYLDQQKTEISSFERKAKILQECLRKSFHSGIEKVALELALDPAIVLIYQQRLLAALDEIVLCKVTALIQEFKGKADYPFSFFYSRARYLLCQAFIGLIERKPYTLNPTAFTLDRILKDYKVKLKEIVRFNLQKLIDKAKTFAPDDQAYQKFLLEFFKISLEELFK
ncbi:MAG TPA: hypothetical protein VMR37_02785, partial [Rhabdochlamydiaceae bacterium]|nr:hypothetical protein [Rhabdochlamydiaceae bacterium]